MRRGGSGGSPGEKRDGYTAPGGADDAGSHHAGQARPGEDAVIEQEEQHQHGRSPKDRDIDRREAPGHRILPGAEQADQRAQQRTDQQRQSGDLDRVTHRPPRIVFQEPPRIRILSSFSSNVICAYPPDSPVNSRSAAPTKPVQQW